MWALSPACLLARRCHSHLVAHDCIRKAMLITIVTRTLFLAGSVPRLRGGAGLCPLWAPRIKAGYDGSSGTCSCFHPLPFCATTPTLPITCWLLPWVLPTTTTTTFSPGQCPQRSWGACGPVREAHKTCSKKVLNSRDFWGSNRVFSVSWGLWCPHSTNTRGEMVAGWILLTSFSCWRVKCSFHELYWSPKLCSSFQMAEMKDDNQL